ncbi:hypothetical protein TNCV_1668111 [Trichonephila clavipes]|nr:hypothetical protein TNCV_1668111 [Trichonephila clavipes]
MNERVTQTVLPTSLRMFNGSPIRHMADIKSIGVFIPNFVQFVRDKNHMASDRVNVETMQNELYSEALRGQSNALVQLCSTNRLIRDSSEAMHHLAAK